MVEEKLTWVSFKGVTSFLLVTLVKDLYDVFSIILGFFGLGRIMSLLRILVSSEGCIEVFFLNLCIICSSCSRVSSSIDTISSITFQYC